MGGGRVWEGEPEVIDLTVSLVVFHAPASTLTSPMRSQCGRWQDKHVTAGEMLCIIVEFYIPL